MLKSKKTYQIPSTAQMKDVAAKKSLQEIGDIIIQIARNIYDDLNNNTIHLVDALPTTAQQDRRGILYLRRGTGGAADELFMVVDTGGEAFGFKQIALT